eukprot:639818-Lingulodinium_polyedra.AAC.1
MARSLRVASWAIASHSALVACGASDTASNFASSPSPARAKIVVARPLGLMRTTVRGPERH